jgi:sulfate permease, SulP family
VVSATTATSALSAAAIGPLAGGDATRFAALSAGPALTAAVVLVAAGLLRLGGLSDLVSKPVMTGFLFGLGLTITLGQLPKVLGISDGDGTFFARLWQLLGALGGTHGWTLAVGAASLILLVAAQRLAPAFPSTLALLVLTILISALLDLPERGVDIVGKLPSAFPHPSVPDVSWGDLVGLLPAAFGIMVVSTEAVGVARALASTDGYGVDPNRELIALGGANAHAGFSGAFVQSGGASQTAAAERAGGKSQLASMMAAALVLLTGAFLAPLFTDLPQATLAAIVIAPVAGFFRVDELHRFARVRRSALLFALTALLGVLVLGVLPGLLVAAALSLVVLIRRLSRPPVGTLARDPATGAWGKVDRHPDWEPVPDFLVARVDGPLFYANAENVKDHLLANIRAADKRPRVLVLELDQSDIDLESLDTLTELVEALASESVELRLASVRGPVLELLRRSGLAERVRMEPTLDAAVRPGMDKLPPGVDSQARDHLWPGGTSRLYRGARRSGWDTDLRYVARALYRDRGVVAAPAVPCLPSKGTVLDGIPESIVLGLSLLGGGVSVAMLAAVFISNLPETLSSTPGLSKSGWPRGRTLGLWVSVTVVSALSSLAGYARFDEASGVTVAFVQACAGGALLTMLADTMMPEAFKYGGKQVGLVTTVGFALAFFITTVE